MAPALVIVIGLAGGALAAVPASATVSPAVQIGAPPGQIGTSPAQQLGAPLGLLVPALPGTPSTPFGNVMTQLQDAKTGLDLDSNYVNPASPATGAVYTDPGNGGSYQNWILLNNTDANGDATGQFRLQDVQTGLCLDSNYVNPASPATGAVYTDPCNGGTYQNWGLG
jgi:hypothetical protein